MNAPVRILEKLLDGLTVLILILLVVLVALQVVFRFIGFAAPWTEEMARFAFVYITFLGAVLALKERSHIVIDVLVDRLPSTVRRTMGIVFGAVVAAFLLLVIWGSVITFKVNAQVTAASLPWFKMTYAYFAVLLGGILMLGYTIRDIVRLGRGKNHNTLSSGGENR
ncbi:MAG TPA: TRAP transporter small permease [Firmicutes bacterium]|jgi:TRAP-type C4-dicarboxylate transport system permease small subunit|nr:TRAP-type transport system small permease protein [Bacillota bacterium]HHV58230.1 TRAP transporter small permease [Bacillota bacterium]